MRIIQLDKGYAVRETLDGHNLKTFDTYSQAAKAIEMGLGFNDGFAFWEHYCKVQKDIMGFEKGTPCDWCGLTEDDIFRETEIQELPVNGK